MQRISHKATERTPLVEFDFAGHHLVMEGESYPEDAPGFFGPILEALREYLDGLADGARVVFDLKMSYFNSSSAKALMNMFQMLEAAARGGCSITINWHYLEDDDTMEEFGQDFSEDFEGVEFRMCPITGYQE